ncbi:hypothetical protein SDRG_10263 [Saprolegnia diclina VS20]|uniref:MYND-type domain-containing protein n=1 Tax=Saprolegnia diclina (strain VS20) TaxID=1156394 RepID=T0QBK9_SAPDV|nr:hypothetical protein SDRG_10263 [Saprolegnia diclina VS20]EQC32066.1 hypothetical protein SDRG_10263 [Saprolegnia diclina VS20]|eukprot:XP_008614468.1 hypothetical protein SDRG_10263 [Saprolegnia diclina VS20]
MAHLENEFLSKKYQKWDNFKDDDDDDTAVPVQSQTQYDHSGDADIEIVDQMLLTRGQLDKFKKLDQTKQEIWQIVVRKLRVWSASSQGAEEGDDAIPCRPYAILVNNIYPLGQVVSKKICDPPEVYPSAREILELSLNAMADPPSKIPQHRPDKIVFADKALVGQLRLSYAALGIECTYLTESDGIDACISELSGHLVRKDLASIGSVSEKPGLPLPADAIQAWYEACATFVDLSPWRKLVERQSIQIDTTSCKAGRSTSRCSATRRTRTKRVSRVRRPLPPTSLLTVRGLGLALFFTRTDLQRRVLPPGQTLALMENPSLRRCAACDKKAPAGADLKRCTRCQCVFYCDATCQRSHWKDHKVNCVDPTIAAASDDGKKAHNWGARELSVFFGGVTSMPFDDLDAIDAHGCRIAHGMYPTPMLFRHGEPSTPLVSDLLWLTRGLEAMNAMLKTAPGFVNASMAGLLGLHDAAEEAKISVEIPSLVAGTTETVVLRNSSVLSMQDVDALRSAVEKKKKARVDDTAEEKADASANNEGSCVLM